MTGGQGQLWTDTPFILSNFRRQNLVGWYCTVKEGLSLLSVPRTWDKKMGGWEWIEMTNGGSSTNVEVYFNKM